MCSQAYSSHFLWYTTPSRQICICYMYLFILCFCSKLMENRLLVYKNSEFPLNFGQNDWTWWKTKTEWLLESKKYISSTILSNRKTRYLPKKVLVKSTSWLYEWLPTSHTQRLQVSYICPDFVLFLTCLPSSSFCPIQTSNLDQLLNHSQNRSSRSLSILLQFACFKDCFLTILMCQTHSWFPFQAQSHMF